MGKWLDNIDGEAHIRVSTMSEDRSRPVAWVQYVFPLAIVFLFLIVVDMISVRFYDLRPLPPPRSWRAIVVAPLALAGIVWLLSQRNAWKESHGP